MVRRGVLEGTDDRFDFTHERIRAVINADLLMPQRKLLHRQIAVALETVHADDLETHFAALGTHYRASEVWDKAVHYLRQAGLKAAARSAPQDARRWFEQALRILDTQPESVSTLEQGFEIRLELRPVLNLLGDVRQVLERLREAEALADKLHDDHRRGRVCAVVTNVHSLVGELDKALVTGARALEIAVRLRDLRLRIGTTTFLEQAHYYRGDYERVVGLATENLATLPADSKHEYFGNAVPASVYDRYWLVRGLTELGRFAEAAEFAAEALRLAEATHHAFPVGIAHSAAGWLHLLKGDWATARSLIEHGVTALRAANIVLGLPSAVASSAWVLAQVGETTEALSRFREGKELIERHAIIGIVGLRGEAFCFLGRAALFLGLLDEARTLGDSALEYSPFHAGFAVRALHLLGDVAIHPERFNAERGESHFRQALALAEPRSMRPVIAHCHLGLGKLYRRMGKREQAREHLTIATTMYRDMGMTYWLEEVRTETRDLA